MVMERMLSSVCLHVVGCLASVFPVQLWHDHFIFTCGQRGTWACIYGSALGAILAVVTAAILLLGVYVAVTGSRVANRLAGPFRARWLWTIGAVVLVAWGYKILMVTTGASS